MKNIIIPIIQEESINFVKELLATEEYKVIVGVHESLASKFKKIKSDWLCLKVFENKSNKEEMINALREEIDEGSVLICRRDVSLKTVSRFFNSNADIAIIKQRRSPFKQKIFDFWMKIVKFLFGFYLYEGNPSVIFLHERRFKVIEVVDDISYLTRVNKWKGFTIEEITVDDLKTKFDYNKKKILINLIAWISVSVLSISGLVVYFCLAKVDYLISLLICCFVLVILVCLVISIAMSCLSLTIGDKKYSKAKKIK